MRPAGNEAMAFRAATLALTLLLCHTALAGEAEVRRMMQQRIDSGALIESVRKAPFANFYEVVVRAAEGPLVYYVDEAASVIVSGNVMEASTGRNLTEDF